MLAINPKIKQKAEDIRKKIFGSEVRESLASGIEAISEDVEATVSRQDYVEEQFQNVIDETTGKDVISAPELIAARNGKSNLKTRLDDEHAQVTAQLQQTEQDLNAQLAQKADRSQVDTFEARIEDIIQSSDLDPNKDQEVVDARLGKPTLGSKIQEIDEFSDHYAGSGVGLSSGRTLAWERGSLLTTDGSLYPSSVAIRTSDYIYGKKGNIIFLSDPQYVFTVLEYKSEDNYVIASEIDVNSYTIMGKQTNLFKIVIKRKDGTAVHTGEIRDVSGKLFFSKNEGMFDHLKKEMNFNRLNLISHEGDDYTWEHGIYSIDDGREAYFAGRIRAVDYLEVDKNDIISIGSSLEYYVIMYDEKFNMIDSIKEYRIEDYVIENEVVKYIRPVIKIHNSTTPSSQEIAYASSSFGVYKRTKDAFKGQSSGTDKGYKVKIGGIGIVDGGITSKLTTEPVLASVKNAKYLSDGTLTEPLATGFLYHGSGTDRNLYYSQNQADKLDKIGTLDFDPQRYNAGIGEDGEIIWVSENGRAVFPRVHKAGQYNSSLELTGMDKKPIAWLQNCGIDFARDANGEEYCVFGEYTGANVGEIRLWKVTKPYSDPTNWRIVKTFNQSKSYKQGTENEVWHIHTVQHDPYAGIWYATSGDSDLETKWWYSTDEGESWTELLNGTYWESQIARVLNFVFTEDYIYWGNDYGTNHSLNRVSRGADGVIDPSTRVRLAELNKNQSTYATTLLHSPPGLLMYDRVDTEFAPRTNELEVQFYSFDDEKVHTLTTLERDPSKPNSFFGLRCKTYTLYQGIYDTKMIVGFGTSPNWMVMPYNDTERRTTLTFDIY